MRAREASWIESKASWIMERADIITTLAIILVYAEVITCVTGEQLAPVFLVPGVTLTHLIMVFLAPFAAVFFAMAMILLGNEMIFQLYSMAGRDYPWPRPKK